MRINLSQLSLTLLLLVFSLCMVSCSQVKKCQSAEVIKSVVGKQLRLVSTTNPVFARNLDNYNFSIISFTNTFTCSVSQVKNNYQYQTASLNCAYSIKDKQLTVQYYTPPTTPSSDPNDLGTKSGAPETYNMDLATDVKWATVTPNNYTYRWVEFKGAVNPDQTCEF